MKTKKLLFYLLAGVLAGCLPVMSLHPLYTEKDLVFEEKLLGTWVTEKDLAFEEKGIGVFVQDSNKTKKTNETTWEFKRIVEDPNMSREHRFSYPDEPEKAYELVYSRSDGSEGSFFAHLVKLNKRFFLDIYPTRLPFADAMETIADAWITANHKEPNDQNPGGLDPNKLEVWICNSWFLLPLHTFIKVDTIEPQLRMQLTDDDEIKKLLEEDPNAVEHTSTEDKLVLTASNMPMIAEYSLKKSS